MDRNPPIWTLTTHKILSLSARRAWIEMIFPLCQLSLQRVALRKESVDRNTVTKPCFQQSRVALRKESVDRNGCGNILVMSENVALRKESVDRNCNLNVLLPKLFQSLSARRAWIEIVITAMTSQISVSRSPQGERG